MLRKAFLVGGLSLFAAALTLATPGVGRAQYYGPRRDNGGGQIYYRYGPNGWYPVAPSPTFQNYSPSYYNTYPSYPSYWPSPYYNVPAWRPFAGGVPNSPGGVAPFRPFVGGPQNP